MPKQLPSSPSVPRHVDANAHVSLRLREPNVSHVQPTHSTCGDITNVFDHSPRQRMNFTLSGHSSPTAFACSPLTVSAAASGVVASGSRRRAASASLFSSPSSLSSAASPQSPLSPAALLERSTAYGASSGNSTVSGGGGLRAAYWTAALALPSNAAAYAALHLRKGCEAEADAALADASDLIKTDRQARGVRRLWLSLAMAEPQLRRLPFVPYLCVAVSRSLPTSPMTAFETAMHLLGNVTPHWQQQSPAPLPLPPAIGGGGGGGGAVGTTSAAIGAPTTAARSSTAVVAVVGGGGMGMGFSTPYPPSLHLAALDDLFRAIEASFGESAAAEAPSSSFSLPARQQKVGEERSLWEHLNYGCGASAYDYFWLPLQTFFLYNFRVVDDSSASESNHHASKTAAAKARRAVGIAGPNMTSSAVEAALERAWQSLFDDIVVPRRCGGVVNSGGNSHHQHHGCEKALSSASSIGGGGLTPPEVFSPIAPSLQPSGYPSSASAATADASAAVASVALAASASASHRTLLMTAVALVLLKRRALFGCTSREEVHAEMARGLFSEADASAPLPAPLAAFVRSEEKATVERSVAVGVPARHFSRWSVRPSDVISHQMRRLRALIKYTSLCAFGKHLPSGQPHYNDDTSADAASIVRPLLHPTQALHLRQLTTVVPPIATTMANASFSSSSPPTDEQRYLQSLLEAGVASRLHSTHPSASHYSFLRGTPSSCGAASLGGVAGSFVCSDESTMGPSALAARVLGIAGMTADSAGRVPTDYYPQSSSTPSATVAAVSPTSASSAVAFAAARSLAAGAQAAADKYATLEAIEASEAEMYRSVKNELETLELMRGVRMNGGGPIAVGPTPSVPLAIGGSSNTHANAALYAQYEALQGRVVAGHPPIAAATTANTAAAASTYEDATLGQVSSIGNTTVPPPPRTAAALAAESLRHHSVSVGGGHHTAHHNSTAVVPDSIIEAVSLLVRAQRQHAHESAERGGAARAHPYLAHPNAEVKAEAEAVRYGHGAASAGRAEAAAEGAYMYLGPSTQQDQHKQQQQEEEVQHTTAVRVVRPFVASEATTTGAAAAHEPSRRPLSAFVAPPPTVEAVVEPAEPAHEPPQSSETTPTLPSYRPPMAPSAATGPTTAAERTAHYAQSSTRGPSQGASSASASVAAPLLRVSVPASVAGGSARRGNSLTHSQNHRRSASAARSSSLGYRSTEGGAAGGSATSGAQQQQYPRSILKKG